MKKFIIVLVICLCLAILVSACAASDSKGGPTSGGHRPGLSGDSSAGGEMSGDPSVGGDGDFENPGSNEQVKIPAGQLTAAEWSDRDHYDAWLKKCGFDEDQKKGIFFHYANDSIWDMPCGARYLINIVDSENKPVEGVSLSIESESKGIIFSAVSDAKGVVSLFAKVSDDANVTLKATYDGNETIVPWTGEREQTIVLDGVNQKQDIVEIMFVIDTTGSMGDELRYLQAEIDDVIGRVMETLANTTIRIALLFYRDEGDEYVTRYFDFNENIDVVKKNLNDQKAYGGGDYPEAVHTALSEAVSKQWSSGNVTKLLFHVLDAPPHNNERVAKEYRNALYSAARQGIRVIPVASSGVNRETEFLLRMEALLTGGTYTFLTDDSGIGNGHLEPTIDEPYVVELLNSMLVRLIKQYHTGEDIAPVDWRQEVKQNQ